MKQDSMQKKLYRLLLDTIVIFLSSAGKESIMNLRR